MIPKVISTRKGRAYPRGVEKGDENASGVIDADFDLESATSTQFDALFIPDGDETFAEQLESEKGLKWIRETAANYKTSAFLVLSFCLSVCATPAELFFHRLLSRRSRRSGSRHRSQSSSWRYRPQGRSLSRFLLEERIRSCPESRQRRNIDMGKDHGRKGSRRFRLRFLRCDFEPTSSRSVARSRARALSRWELTSLVAYCRS